MKSKLILILLGISVAVFSCKKKQDNIEPPLPNAPINVSSQWLVDNVGNLISGMGDGQWQKKVFTTQEQNLFNSLDTANLVGTLKPDSVIDAPTKFNYIYPNPFASQFRLSLQFSNGFNGQIGFKYVIVDSVMNVVAKGALKIQATACVPCPLQPSSTNIAFMPAIPLGKFRFYFSLSSQANPFFYTTWGNINRTQ